MVHINVRGKVTDLDPVDQLLIGSFPLQESCQIFGHVFHLQFFHFGNHPLLDLLQCIRFMFDCDTLTIRLIPVPIFSDRPLLTYINRLTLH